MTAYKKLTADAIADAKDLISAALDGAKKTNEVFEKIQMLEVEARKRGLYTEEEHPVYRHNFTYNHRMQAVQIDFVNEKAAHMYFNTIKAEDVLNISYFSDSKEGNCLALVNLK